MEPVGTRDLRKRGRRRALLLAISIGVLAITLALLMAGCSSGGGTNTTTTTFTQPDETTTTTGLPGELTTSTETAVEDTSTTATSVVEETTTSSTGPEEATTTTEKLSTAEQKLANGHIKALGYIKKVWEQNGKRYISIDYAEMLTGQAAIDAAVAAGEIQPGEDLPNDYYIRNTNKQERQFEVSGSAAITTSTWNASADEPRTITWADFVSLWSATPPEDAVYLRDAPWWIERDGQTVIKIDEQYLP
jgi:hypothetical protein